MSQPPRSPQRATHAAPPLVPALCLLTILLVLYLRVTRGVDITDEIQYYGEIKGLVEQGRLFTTDLFLQQSVYILFYPLFWLYHKAFGYEGLVAFGRLTLAALMLAVYFFAKGRLFAVTQSRSASSLCALALTFAVPYHGVMSLSYNTVSQLMWIMFGLWFLDWSRNRSATWTVIPVITAFAHPTSAVAMVAMALIRMAAERDIARIVKSLIAMAAMGMVLLPVALHFAAIPQYQASLSFSSGYGVGDTFFNSFDGPATLTRIILLFAVITVCMRLVPGTLARPWGPLLCAGLAYALMTPFTAPLSGYGSSAVKLLTILCAAAYAWALRPAAVSSATPAQASSIQWLMAMLLGYASTLAITSGNGLWQATGALMMALPLLLAAVIRSPKGTVHAGLSHTVLVAASVATVCLALAHWSAYPYRESRWWQTTEAVPDIPEFRHLRTTPARADLLAQVRQTFSAVTQGRPTLVVTDYPGLYFALGARIESCMVYMHSITSDTSEQRLMACMADKKPEVIVDVYASDAPEYTNSRIKRLMRHFYEQRPGHCTTTTRTFSHRDPHLPASLTFHVCEMGAR